uniref:Uncharacterized protein n=1 Tax=Opuntia streptacantha TaxID=393608 RepID=A0A7C9AZH2_OPUST
MEGREKGGGSVYEEKEEFPGLKLKRSICFGKSKGGGVCTPPPTWTFRPHTHTESALQLCNGNSSVFCSNNSVSARQLGANLWEILPHLPSLARMSNHRKLGGGFSKNKGLQMQPVLEDPPDSASDEQPVSTGTFHRQIAASLMRHHRSVNRNGHALQPMSPASNGSSMEITPYNPLATPSSSLEYKGRMGDPSCSLKSSTELLKVLNRIWCLEQQHASNASHVKTLKMELDDARTRIKQLLREKQMDRQVIDSLMKQVSEIKLVKKKVDQDRVQSALQSVREELEDERKLRKCSESMHRKLAREISEMKSSFSKVLSDLERERRARILLEDLCDEFALGIRDYEQELRSLKYRTEKEQVQREHVDSLVLHISEAWLDERVQMKLAEEMRKDVGEKGMIVDKLRPEIESFLKARQNLDSRENVDLPTKHSKGIGFRRQSLESFPLNEATSAPKNVDDEDDDGSTDSDSHCFELNKNLGGEYSNGVHSRDIDVSKERNLEEKGKMDAEKRKGESREMNGGRSLSTLQTRFEKHIARVISSNGKTQKEGTPLETNTSHMSGNQEGSAEEGLLDRRSKRFGSRGGNTNHMNMIDSLLRNNSSSIEGERIYPESELVDDTHGHFLSSPVKKWEPKLTSQDSEMLESSRWPRAPKETSLKARLLEARLEGRYSQPKVSKGSA